MPQTIKGYQGSVSFDGSMVTVKKSMRGETRIPISQLAGVAIVHAGWGMRGIQFITAASSASTSVAMGSHKKIAEDPQALTFRKKHVDEFQALADEVTAAIAAR